MVFQMYFRPLIFIFTVLLSLGSCKEKQEEMASVTAEPTTHSLAHKKESKPLSEDFKKYWFAGEAEITSYRLEQARYGEIREGEAVLIFVTEPFAPEKQVKADQSSPSNVSVLKLNATKNFLTGIYPYSIMSSTFYPVADNQHAIKVTSSIQEWCGQVYAQLNNREKFEIQSFSYFEAEGDQNLKLEKNHLENEIWSRLRINPDALPKGEISIIPSLEYLRLVHKPIKSYQAVAKREENDEMSVYTLTYPELQRELKITYSTTFPHEIQGWTDSYPSGFGPSAKVLTTKAAKIESLKTPYWRRNGNEDVSLRDSLGI
ncbi:MAG: septum formation inhibitor Maf [Muriicola sp.]|nr:septum formation inhibitor Maf [Muriicola sp.]NNK11465.1 septum formation inhibitor Maf [Flavobacteriaceae bacterium]